MSDNLKYGVEFQVAEGIKKAQEDWKKQQATLKKTFVVPVTFKPSLDAKTKLQKTLSGLKGLKIDPISPKSSKNIAALNDRLKSLGGILTKINNLNLKGSKITSDAALAENRLAGARAKDALAQQRSSAAASKRRIDEEKLLDTKKKSLITSERLRVAREKSTASRKKSTAVTNSQSNAMFRQTGMMNGLTQSLNAYVSILGLTRLVSNIREVTAEFELQRVALQAIIQDKAAADRIFAQIQEAALRSPFQIKDLISYTKQLSAYRVETDKLFETTQRLADISAGLGVDMNRLVLAYGQVRAASVLRGQELRQFTEAGIPLVQLLADKFTKLNGEMVSTGDVFELISKRAVSFRDVEEIFNDMTDAGGTFYMMQEIQAETLKGIWSNLRDAYDKAFYEIGRENEDVMKGIGKGLIDLADSWRVLETAGSSAILILGTYKLAVLATSRAVKVLTGAQARALAVETSVAAIRTKKLLKSLLGETVALKVAAVQTKILFTQKLKLAAANSFLTKTYRRLTVAMLTNPAAVAITAIIVPLALLYSSIKKANKEQEAFEKRSEASAKALRTFRRDAEQAYKGISDVVSAGVADDATEDNIIKARVALQDILEENRNLIPLVRQRLDLATSEIEKLKELKALYENINSGLSDEAIVDIVNVSRDESKTQKDVIGRIKKDSDDITDYASTISGAVREVNSALSGYSDSAEAEGLFDSVPKDIEKLRKSFAAGEITISQLFEKYKAYRKDVEGLREFSIAYLPTGMGGSSTKIVSDLNEETGELARVLDSSLRKFDTLKQSSDLFFGAMQRELGKQYKGIDFTKDFFGLDEDGFKRVEGEVTKVFTAIENGLSDDGLKGLDVIKSLFSEYANTNLFGSTEPPKLTAFEETINALIEAKNLKAEPIIAGDFENETAIIKVYKEKYSALEVSIAKSQQAMANGSKRYTAEQVTEDKKRLASLETLLKFIGVFDEKSKPKTSTKNTRQAALLAEIKAVEEAFKRYNDLKKVLPDNEAQKKTVDLYGETFSKFKSLGKLNPVFSLDGLNEVLSSAIKKGKAYLDDKGNLKLNLSISENSVKQTVLDLKEQLDNAANNLSKQKEANKFYEKILGSTGNIEIAQKLTLATTGLDFKGIDIRKALTDQLKLALKGTQVAVPGDILGNVDLIRGAFKFMGEDVAKNAEQALTALIDFEQSSVASLYDTLADFSSYEDRKTVISQKAAMERAEIDKVITDEALADKLKASSITKERQSIATVDFEKLKGSDEWIKTFEDLDRLSTGTLNRMLSYIQENGEAMKGLDPTQLKEMSSAIQNLVGETENRDPFGTIRSGLDLLTKNASRVQDAISGMADIKTKEIGTEFKLSLATDDKDIARLVLEIQDLKDEYGKLENFVDSSADVSVLAVDKISKGLAAAEKDVSDFGSALSGIASAWSNITGNDDDGFSSALNSISEGFSSVASAIGVAQSALALYDVAIKIFEASSPLGWLTLAAGAIIGVFKAIESSSTKKYEANIEDLEYSLERLEKAKQSLDKEFDKAVGSSKIAVSRDVIRNLEEQIKAEEDLIANEKARAKSVKPIYIMGFKVNKKKMEEDEKYIQEKVDAIAEHNELILEEQEKLRESFAGESLNSAAETFASAWLDAYLSFSDTSEAIQAEYGEMIKNMIIQGKLAEIWEKALEPAFLSLDKALADENVTESEIAEFAKLLEKGENEGDDRSTALLDALVASGAISRDAGGESNLSGISKDIASLTEETALTLGANLQNMSYEMIEIHGDTAAIRAILEAKYGITEGVSVITFAQLQSLSADQVNKMQEIKNDTAIIASSTQEQLALLSSVIGPRGASTPKVLNTVIR